jgi:hypothetical protein
VYSDIYVNCEDRKESKKDRKERERERERENWMKEKRLKDIGVLNKR